MSDLRYALRGLLRSPGFALAAILTLTLGIGANTAIFSVVDAVLLRPLPYPQSGRLVMVFDQLMKLGLDRFPLSSRTFDAYRCEARTFEASGAFMQLDRNLGGDTGVEQVSSMMVSDGLLAILGAQPQVGRAFTAEEYQSGHEGVAILGHSLFLSRFGGDRNIVGKSVNLDGRSHTVVGVMPAGFDFSLRTTDVDLWTPLPISSNQRWGSLRMLARLRPGVSLAAAQSALTATAKHLDEAEHPYRGPNGEDADYRVKIVSLREQLLGEFRGATIILLCAVAAVLLIACVNVANLLLVRALARKKEIALRRALGATDARLIRQWMTEAGVLSVLGGLFGSIAAVWGVRVLVALSPAALPGVARIGVDLRALGFTLVISALVCAAFGLAPWFAAPGKRDGMHWGMRGSGSQRRAAPVLVTAEVALAVMLLVGAGLLIKSYSLLSHVDPGFNPNHLLTMRIQYPPSRPIINTRSTAFFAEVRDRLAAIPGVSAAAEVSRLPVAGGLNARGGDPFSIEGRPYSSNSAVPQVAHAQTVSLDYFHTLEIPLRAGRTFELGDSGDAPLATIVNETMVRGFFPHGAIGQHIMLGAPTKNPAWMTIVGVVADVKTAALDHDAMPQIYVPNAQRPSTGLALLLRTRNDPMTVARQAAAVVHSLDPEMPVYDISTMEDRVARSIGQPKFEAFLVAFFAATALFLAAIGIFGVVAHSTSQRTQEIGIRMALGADAARVLGAVIIDGLKPVAAGVVIGLGGALALGQMLSATLFHVAPSDPATFVLAALVLTLVAIAACLGPARKATRIDPMAALRAE